MLVLAKTIESVAVSVKEAQSLYKNVVGGSENALSLRVENEVRRYTETVCKSLNFDSLYDRRALMSVIEKSHQLKKGNRACLEI